MLPEVARLPHRPGVYRFRGARGRLLYLGRAVDLRRRVASYWGDLRDRRHLRRMMGLVERVEAVECDSAHEAAWLERSLLEHRKPPWNRSRGEEVPVLVRVDGRPRSPGLAVVHRARAVPGVAHFGPYLGGTQARLAVAGLGRVLPLAHARQPALASERELALVRGVVPADREALLAAVHGVLARDPGAVTAALAALAGLRDAAAGELAFEQAAGLQAELDALAWLVAEQKVVSAEPVDHDVAGFADGLLVEFGIRAGRLRTWSQRECSARAARAALAATPPAWVAFAQRGARLAAALAAATTAGDVADAGDGEVSAAGPW